MIVRLTDAQRAACELYGRQEHRLWLCDSPVGRAERAGKTSWDVPMPPIGWRTLLDQLERVAFNEHGRRSSRVSGSVHRAVKRVARSLARLEAHPAFTGTVGLPGESSDVFVGWPSHQRWTPYPAAEGDPVWLVPQWLTVGGVRVTTWFPGLPSPGWNGTTLDPAEHQWFIGASAS